MKFKLADIQNYTQSAPEHSEKNYQIVFSAVGNRRIEPEVKAVVQRLARQRKNSTILLEVKMNIQTIFEHKNLEDTLQIYENAKIEEKGVDSND